MKGSATILIKIRFLIRSVSRNILSGITIKFSWEKPLPNSLEEIATVRNIHSRCLIFSGVSFDDCKESLNAWIPFN